MTTTRGDLETASLLAPPRSQSSPTAFSSSSEKSLSNSTPHSSTTAPSIKVSQPLQLLFGAGGIYTAFLYYGLLQEDVFRYTSADGTPFTQPWFLMVWESAANVLVGMVGLALSGGGTPRLPRTLFAISGASQVTSKACTSLALLHGLSYPVATLAKSGKLAPVMLGSLLLGGATYMRREYLQVLAIIGGTAIVSMGKKKASAAATSTVWGVVYICLSLALAGVPGGVQKRLQRDMAKVGLKPKPYDFMLWTNLYMTITAILIAAVLGELTSGAAFVLRNPNLLGKIGQFCVCSAIGQSFIFYTLAHFDPLVLSTVTTTRKIFSVLLSIFFRGHALSLTGWGGIGLACAGILSELHLKASAKQKPRTAKS